MNYTSILSAVLCLFLLISIASASPVDDEKAMSPSQEVVSKENEIVALDAEKVVREQINVDAAGITRAFYWHGWATYNDDGYVLQALWLRNHVDNLDDLPEHERRLAMMGGGVLKLGTHTKARSYKLTKQPSLSDEIVFSVGYLQPTTTASNKEPGSLRLARDPYSDVSTWEGKLTLPGDSESYYVTLGTRSVPVEDMDRVALLIEQRNENTFSSMTMIKNFISKLQSVFN